MMVLQELLFPDLETCPASEMYFRTEENGPQAYVDPEAGTIHVPQWCHLDMDTYFNGFSVGKWCRYTSLNNLSMRLELSGKFRVQLIHWQRLKDKCGRVVVAERICHSECKQFFELSFPGELPQRGMLACSLQAVGEDCVFYGGGYVTLPDEKKLNPVDIAIDICTFKREDFIQRNIDLLNREILQNADCELGEHLEVFISDNGRTLNCERLTSEKVHVFPNRNAGGAGGFARGMLEIIDSPRTFTHTLLMDDDVLIQTESLIRTYRLLQLMKAEYAGKTVAGALMRLDNRHIQYECGATLKGYIPKPRKHNMDMRKIRNVLKNEQEEALAYNGWWYSCIPMSKVSENNLPLPIFVHRDDVEFGLRTGSDILSLNGICVWHESFDNRYSSSMEYYEPRNDLIFNALLGTGGSPITIAIGLLHRVVGNVIRYRYNNCELLFRGVDDFMRGAEYVMALDPEKTHAEVLAASDKFLPLNQLEIPFREKKQVKGLKKKKSRLNTLRVYLLNGIFLPAKGENVVNISAVWPRNFYRRSAVLNYDELTQKGFVSRRSFPKTLSSIFRVATRMGRIILRYKDVAESYQRNREIMTSRTFWEKYLGLKKQV